MRAAPSGDMILAAWALGDSSNWVGFHHLEGVNALLAEMCKIQAGFSGQSGKCFSTSKGNTSCERDEEARDG
jgi:hypothetical protein